MAPSVPGKCSPGWYSHNLLWSFLSMQRWNGSIYPGLMVPSNKWLNQTHKIGKKTYKDNYLWWHITPDWLLCLIQNYLTMIKFLRFCENHRGTIFPELALVNDYLLTYTDNYLWWEHTWLAFVLDAKLPSGSVITNGREPRSCLGRVFNSKLGPIAILGSKCMVCMQPLLKLKTQPKARPVS